MLYQGYGNGIWIEISYNDLSLQLFEIFSRYKRSSYEPLENEFDRRVQGRKKKVCLILFTSKKLRYFLVKKFLLSYF